MRSAELIETCRQLNTEHWIAPEELIAREIENMIGASLERDNDKNEERS